MPGLSVPGGLDMMHHQLDRPATLTCPECGGALHVHEEGMFRYYTCHIGHALTPKTMLIQQFMEVERQLSVCIRTLNERAEMCRQMAERHRAETGHATAGVSNAWEAARAEALEQAEIVAGVLERKWLDPFERALSGGEAGTRRCA